MIAMLYAQHASEPQAFDQAPEGRLSEPDDAPQIWRADASDHADELDNALVALAEVVALPLVEVGNPQGGMQRVGDSLTIKHSARVSCL